MEDTQTILIHPINFMEKPPKKKYKYRYLTLLFRQKHEMLQIKLSTVLSL